MQTLNVLCTVYRVPYDVPQDLFDAGVAFYPTAPARGARTQIPTLFLMGGADEFAHPETVSMTLFPLDSCIFISFSLFCLTIWCTFESEKCAVFDLR